MHFVKSSVLISKDGISSVEKSKKEKQDHTHGEIILSTERDSFVSEASSKKRQLYAEEIHSRGGVSGAAQLSLCQLNATNLLNSGYNRRVTTDVGLSVSYQEADDEDLALLEENLPATLTSDEVQFLQHHERCKARQDRANEIALQEFRQNQAQCSPGETLVERLALLQKRTKSSSLGTALKGVAGIVVKKRKTTPVGSTTPLSSSFTPSPPRTPLPLRSSSSCISSLSPAVRTTAAIAGPTTTATTASRTTNTSIDTTSTNNCTFSSANTSTSNSNNTGKTPVITTTSAPSINTLASVTCDRALARDQQDIPSFPARSSPLSSLSSSASRPNYSSTTPRPTSPLLTSLLSAYLSDDED